MVPFNSHRGMNNAKATGWPRGGQGGSLDQACNILRASELLVTHGGHSINTRRGASKNGPSFVCGMRKKSFSVEISVNFNLKVLHELPSTVDQLLYTR